MLFALGGTGLTGELARSSLEKPRIAERGDLLPLGDDSGLEVSHRQLASHRNVKGLICNDGL